MSEIDWSKAPEGATHAAFGDDNVPGWYRKEAGCWLFFPDSCGPKEWTADCSQTPERDRPGFICRAAEWRGPEDGLPPAGTVCEARHHGGWAECEIIAHVRAPENRIEAVYQAADDWDWLSSPSNFRPIKSDKERAVEAALAQDCDPRDGMLSRHDFCARLYDAGLLRLPEEQS